VAGEIDQAVQLKVEQFAQAQPSATQDGQAMAGERACNIGDGGHRSRS